MASNQIPEHISRKVYDIFFTKVSNQIQLIMGELDKIKVPQEYSHLLEEAKVNLISQITDFEFLVRPEFLDEVITTAQYGGSGSSSTHDANDPAARIKDNISEQDFEDILGLIKNAYGENESKKYDGTNGRIVYELNKSSATTSSNASFSLAKMAQSLLMSGACLYS